MNRLLSQLSLIALVPSLNANAQSQYTFTNATFASEKMIAPESMGAHSIAAADLDGDGDPDAVSAFELEDKIVWFENTIAETGTFGPERLISEMVNGPVTVFLADIDGDGDVDVVSASHIDHKVAWYENTDGQGTFGPQRVISTENTRARGLCAADFDGDGDYDVLCASDEITWWENLDGKGNFGPTRPLTVDATVSAAAWADDLDGDGDMDALAVSVPDNKVEWFENLDGKGNFGPSRVLSLTAMGAYAVRTGDFDGDGDADVLSASLSDWTVEWFENLDGKGNFGPSRLISTNAKSAHGVFVADADGDGDLDVFSASVKDHKLAWYENLDGKGHFSPEKIITNTATGAASTCVVDLDGDGDRDILLAAGHETTEPIENIGKVVWFENLIADRPFELPMISYDRDAKSVTILWNSRRGGCLRRRFFGGLVHLGTARIGNREQR